LGKDPAGQKPAKGANVAAVKPENAEVDAMEPEKAADHAEPEVIQAAIPGAVMDGMTDVHPKYEPPPLDEVAPVDAPLNEASVASRLGQPIAGVLFLSLLANLLL
jgi:hypothetical protein